MKRDKRGNRVIRGLQLWLMILLKMFHLILIESARRDRNTTTPKLYHEQYTIGMFRDIWGIKTFLVKKSYMKI